MCRTMCTGLVLLLIASPAQADLIGLWQFDGDLNNTAGTSAQVVNLDATNYPTIGAWPLVFVSETIAGQSATALSFPQFTNRQALTLVNPVGDNGGGTFTNAWTIVMDVRFPVVPGAQINLLQTQQDNTNDGDLLLRSDGTLGLDTFHGPVDYANWTRLAITMTPESGLLVMRKYADGVLLGSETGAGPFNIGGRYGLESWVHLFTSSNGENAAGLINSLAFYDAPLSDSEIAALGAASAAGIPVPEPSVGWLLAAVAGGWAVWRRRRRI